MINVGSLMLHTKRTLRCISCQHHFGILTWQSSASQAPPTENKQLQLMVVLSKEAAHEG